MVLCVQCLSFISFCQLCNLTKKFISSPTLSSPGIKGHVSFSYRLTSINCRPFVRLSTIIKKSSVTAQLILTKLWFNGPFVVQKGATKITENRKKGITQMYLFENTETIATKL